MPRRGREDEDGQEGTQDSESAASKGSAPRPSRTELTRAAREVNALGIELTRLAPEVLDRLELPELLREEIAVCQDLKPRGRGRQNRLIGQLLRAEDHEAIRGRLAALQIELRRGVQKEKGNERWLKRILDEGESAIETLIQDHPDADRQRLRTLMRNARQEPKSKATRRARRELLRAIRELRS